MTRVLLLLLLALPGAALAVTDTVTASGNWIAPAGVTSITVETWGGGGAGGGATANPGKGGGGAGGQYAKKVVTVVPGNTYAVVVGSGGVGGTGNGGVGGDSTFDGTVVVAKGGAGGTGVANGVGGLGSAVGGVGDIVYAGGNGANSTVDTNCNTGGGGGGGAGSTGAGGNAVGNTGGAGTAVGGGAGGTATTGSGTGAAGTLAGGAGAGACAENNTNRNGGAGGSGIVVISYSTSGTPIGGCTTTTVGSDTVITCTGDGTVTIPSNVSKVRYLVVGGGGGGGGINSGNEDGAGGGGAGGVLRGTNFAVTAGATYSVTVGASGAAGTGSANGGNGGNSTFSTLTAIGGGGGAREGGWDGLDGGSGGGGSDNNNGGNGTAGQGNDGGDGNSGDGGGGGGGAGANGANGTNTTGGDGGDGVADDITGTSTNYGGGGGGGADAGGNGGAGGLGGGGSGGIGRSAGTAGTANTGGGGGGATGSDTGSAYDGGIGGSGIVVIRYSTSGTPVCATFADQFSVQSYANNDGSLSWAGDWIESNDDGVASSGNILVSNNQLQFIGGGSVGRIEREANLSTYTSATLSFDYSQSGSESGDSLIVDISSDGGSTWTTIHTIAGGGASQVYTDDISAFLSGNFRIRFAVDGNRSNDLFYIDNVQIEACGASGPDHVRLNHTGSAVTCLGEQVTVYVCNDADSGGICTANTSGLTGNVVAKSTGGATLATVPFTIAAGESSTTVTVPVTTAQTVTFETSGLSATPTASSAWTCWDGSAASCSNTYSDAGFIVSSAAGDVEATIPAQTAGVSSGTYYLRAVKTSTTTKACESALTGANTVNFGYECVNPTTCYGVNLMSVNGGTSTTIARNNDGSVADYTSVNMTFDANGNAPFTLNYGDVGLVKLYMNKAADAVLLSALTGSSNAFVVKPHHFELSGIKCSTIDAANCGAGALAMPTSGDNPAAADAAGVTFIRAGDPFTVTVTAKSSSGATTPNYGKEATAESVKLISVLVAPAGGANGTLTGTFGAFSSGVATADGVSLLPDGVTVSTSFSWNEVGIITLTPSVADTNYLGAGDVSGTVSGNVGRFYPHHFDTAVVTTTATPMPCPNGLLCPDSKDVLDGFVYSGQPFSVRVTAMNLAGDTTANYDGAFALSKAVTLSAVDASGGAAIPTVAPGGTLTSSAVAAAAFADGVATQATPVYTFAAAATAPTDIFLRAADTDGVTSLRASAATSVEGGVTVASGRIRLSNAHGSELLALPLTALVQYYNGNAWVRSDTDTVTTLVASDFALAFPAGTASRPNNLAACETALAVAGTSPTFALNLSAPGSGNNGWTNLTLNLGAAAAGSQCTAVGGAGAAATTANRPWLQFPSGADPTVRATFGVYKGNNEFIYLRENY